MIVVSNTSAISNLLQIEQIDLLRTLFGSVLITPAVQRELYRVPLHKNQLSTLNWFRLHEDLIKDVLKRLGES